MKKTISEKENRLIYEDFNAAKKDMAVKKIAFNLAKQEFDDFGWHLHDAEYWQTAAAILYDEATKRGLK